MLYNNNNNNNNINTREHGYLPCYSGLPAIQVEELSKMICSIARGKQSMHCKPNMLYNNNNINTTEQGYLPGPEHALQAGYVLE